MIKYAFSILLVTSFFSGSGMQLRLNEYEEPYEELCRAAENLFSLSNYDSNLYSRLILLIIKSANGRSLNLSKEDCELDRGLGILFGNDFLDSDWDGNLFVKRVYIRIVCCRLNLSALLTRSELYRRGLYGEIDKGDDVVASLPYRQLTPAKLFKVVKPAKLLKVVKK